MVKLPYLYPTWLHATVHTCIYLEGEETCLPEEIEVSNNSARTVASYVSNR